MQLLEVPFGQDGYHLVATNGNIYNFKYEYGDKVTNEGTLFTDKGRFRAPPIY